MRHQIKIRQERKQKRWFLKNKKEFKWSKMTSQLEFYSLLFFKSVYIKEKKINLFVA